MFDVNELVSSGCEEGKEEERGGEVGKREGSRLLATLSSHSQAVNVVRWSDCGR